MAEGDFVIVHGRYSGHGLPRELDCSGHSSDEGPGSLMEHWDVIQDEATRESSKSGLPMFGEQFIG